jgi:non-canonical poly(A) RNA polymerase PAPD5/7
MYDVIQIFEDESNGMRIEESLHKARVPILKCIHIETNINVDLVFNEKSGLPQIKQFENAIMNYPEFKFMYLLLKFFLRQRRLNETYSGGVGKALLNTFY